MGWPGPGLGLGPHGLEANFQGHGPTQTNILSMALMAQWASRVGPMQSFQVSLCNRLYLFKFSDKTSLCIIISSNITACACIRDHVCRAPRHPTSKISDKIGTPLVAQPKFRSKKVLTQLLTLHDSNCTYIPSIGFLYVLQNGLRKQLESLQKQYQ